MTPVELADWNARNPRGTVVVAWPGGRLDGAALHTRTRSAAWIDLDTVPRVAVKGYPGGVPLADVDVLDGDVDVLNGVRRHVVPAGYAGGDSGTVVVVRLDDVRAALQRLMGDDAGPPRG